MLEVAADIFIETLCSTVKRKYFCALSLKSDSSTSSDIPLIPSQHELQSITIKCPEAVKLAVQTSVLFLEERQHNVTLSHDKKRRELAKICIFSSIQHQTATVQLSSVDNKCFFLTKWRIQHQQEPRWFHMTDMYETVLL